MTGCSMWKGRILLVALLLLNLYIGRNQWKALQEKRKRDAEEAEIQRKEAILRGRIRAREATIKELEEYHDLKKEAAEVRLPAVIGIGTKKCGTDGLLRFLGHHPLIKLPDKIDLEAFFFTNKYTKGVTYYKSLFPPINDKEITMEKTPSYFDSPPYDVPNQIASTLPGIKLLLIICDPTKRAFSDFIHERVRYQLFNDKTIADYSTFDDYLAAYLPKLNDNLKRFRQNHIRDDAVQRFLTDFFWRDQAATLLSTGLYYFHIQRWFRSFNRSDLMIIDGDDFIKNPGEIIEQVEDFIRIPKLIWKEDFVKNPKTGFFCYRRFTETYMNKSLVMSEDEMVATLSCLHGENKGRTRMGRHKPNNNTMNQLREFYRPYNKAFFNLVGKNYSWG